MAFLKNVIRRPHPPRKPVGWGEGALLRPLRLIEI